MTTTIRGTDNTAAAPALTGTDTDTGIFFPAADTIAFAEGGAEVARFDSSGNFGIGTTSPLTRTHVQVSALSGYTAVANSGLLIERGNGPAALNIASPNTESGFIWFADQDSASVGNIAYNHPSNFMSFQTNGAERARITSGGDFQFNSGYGSVATAYGCRAWVNFNGTGTVAIRASGNVSSITDNGVGNYTVNFTTSLPDADYGIAAFVGSTTTGVSRCIDNGGVTPTTSSLRITTRNSATGATTDDSIICVSIFR